MPACQGLNGEKKLIKRNLLHIKRGEEVNALLAKKRKLFPDGQIFIL